VRDEDRFSTYLICRARCSLRVKDKLQDPYPLQKNFWPFFFLFFVGERGASPSDRPSEDLGDDLPLSACAFSEVVVVVVVVVVVALVFDGNWKPVLGTFCTDGGGLLGRNTILDAGREEAAPFTPKELFGPELILLTA